MPREVAKASRLFNRFVKGRLSSLQAVSQACRGGAGVRMPQAWPGQRGGGRTMTTERVPDRASNPGDAQRNKRGGPRTVVGIGSIKGEVPSQIGNGTCCSR